MSCYGLQRRYIADFFQVLKAKGLCVNAVCFTLPGIILSGIGKQTANAKWIKHKKTEELYEQIRRSYARHNL